MNPILYELDIRFNTSISVYPTSILKITSSEFSYFQNIRKEGVEV